VNECRARSEWPERRILLVGDPCVGKPRLRQARLVSVQLLVELDSADNSSGAGSRAGNVYARSGAINGALQSGFRDTIQIPRACRAARRG
jgi:hypothetical protein